MNFLIAKKLINNEEKLINNEEDVKEALKAAFSAGSISALWGDWKIAKTTKARSETGWDLVFKRNDGRQILAIETKFVTNKSRASRFEPALSAILIRKNPKLKNSQNEISQKKIFYGIAFNKFDKDDKTDNFLEFIRKKRIQGTERGKVAWEKLYELGARYVFLVDDFTKKVEFYHWKYFLK